MGAGWHEGPPGRCAPKTCEFANLASPTIAQTPAEISARGLASLSATPEPSRGRTATFIQRSPVARRIAKVRSKGDDWVAR